MRTTVASYLLLVLIVGCGTPETGHRATADSVPPRAAASETRAAVTPPDTMPEALSDSLCTSGETMVFGFDVLERHAAAAVCRANADEALVYRYGSRDSLQLRFPSRGDHWRYRFQYSSYTRPGGAGNEGLEFQRLSFVSRDSSCYQLYEEWSAASQNTTVGVRMWAPHSRHAVDLVGANPRGHVQAVAHQEGLQHDESCEPQ